MLRNASNVERMSRAAIGLAVVSLVKQLGSCRPSGFGQRASGTVAIASLLALGCVSSARYDAKVAELQVAEQALAQALEGNAKVSRESSELQARLQRAQAAWLTESSRSERLAVELDAQGRRASALEQSMRERELAVAQLETELRAQRKLLAEFQALAQALGVESPHELHAALAQLKRRVEATERALRSAAAELERERRITQKLQSLIDAGKLRVRTRAGRLVLELPGDIHFASGRANLTPDGLSTLAEVAAALKAEQDRLFMVEGHTDNVPIAVSGFRSNWHLGATRAEMAREALVKSGIESTRLAIATWADLLPACSEVDTKECQRRNRRIEIVLLPRFE